MKYTPKEIKENFNVSKITPVRDFFELTLKVIILILLIYIILGFLVDFISVRISPQMEKKLAKIYVYNFVKEPLIDFEKTKQLEIILQKLLKDAEGLPPFDYKVFVIKSNIINALSLPAGNIVVYEGLLNLTSEEEAIAMILAHELGHFAYRDHLKGLGRNLVFSFLSMIIFGENNKATEIISKLLLTTEMRFSQEEEIKADLYGLNLVRKIYPDKKNILKFYEKMVEKETAIQRFFSFYQTHPSFLKRLKLLQQKLSDNL